MPKIQAEFWKSQLVKGRISRREFIGRVGAIGLTAATAGLIIASADKAVAQTPKKGGRLILGWYNHSAKDTLNPNRLTSSLDFQRAYQTMGSLVRYGHDLSAQPDLATEWESSSDAMTWRFKIKQGVEFHNGKTLTVEDVIYSLNRHRGEDSDSIIKAWLAPITDIRKDGNDTLVIELDGPNGDLPFYFGDMHSCIIPDGFTDFNNAIGTGPYKVKSFEPGVGMLAERFANYYRDDIAHVDEVESFGIGDTPARINALIAGDVHFITRVDPKVFDLINSAPGVTMANAPSSRHITFPMMSDAPPFDNNDLRLAIKYMAERQSMLDNVLKGYGAIGNDTPIGPADAVYCKEIAQREFDPDKAKFHLKKAGMEGATVTLHTSDAAGGSMGPDLALHLSESAKKVGFNIKVQREPADGYWSAIWIKRPFHMSNWLPRPTPDLRYSLVYLTDAKWNESHNGTAELDALITKNRGMVDGPERYAVNCEIQRTIHDTGGSVIPVFTDWLDARSEKLMGWTGHPVGEGDGYRIHETAWLV